MYKCGVWCVVWLEAYMFMVCGVCVVYVCIGGRKHTRVVRLSQSTNPTHPLSKPFHTHTHKQRAAQLQEKARSSPSSSAPSSSTTPLVSQQQPTHLPSHTPPMAPIAVQAAAIPSTHSRSAADLYRQKRQVCICDGWVCFD